jgi:hypothetical protein
MRLTGFIIAAVISLAPFAAIAQEASFRTEIVAILSKAGCNAGACHGNANGKGGFKLSLRGEDPLRDYQTLTREMFSRRLDLTDPSQSLLLLKPTTQVAHEGGLRFAVGSSEYELFVKWIAAGAPDDAATAPRVTELQVTPQQPLVVEPTNQVQLSVQACFSNGTTRDVTSLAVFELADTLAKATPSGLITMSRAGETTVIVRYLDQQQPVRITLVPNRPAVPIVLARNNYIDDHVFSKLEQLRVAPSGLCSDSEFVRRVHLDLLGLLPGAEEAKKFVADTSRTKRQRLVSRLLQRPEFAEFWALKWADLLRNEEKVLDRKGVQAFHRWIRDSIASNQPLDHFVAELLSARGSSYGNPAANFMRALRDPVKRAEATAQVFLGTRLQCAQCHNHPFDRWTQSDYYGWAAAFAPVSYKVISNNRRDGLDTHEFNGEQIIFASAKPKVKDPRSGKSASPRLLGDTASADSNAPDSLARWLVANPQFARAQVNRIWSYLMGRGLVDPVDDVRATNPASNEELFGALAKDFSSNGFDVKRLIRAIMSSGTYQLSAEANATNQNDNKYYSKYVVKRLPAEVLLDAMSQVTGVPTRFANYPAGSRALQLPDTQVRSEFLSAFGRPNRVICDAGERSSEPSIAQALHVINGETLNRKLSAPDGYAALALKLGLSDARILDHLFLSAYSRFPSEEEKRPMLEELKKHRAATGSTEVRREARRQALEDMMWALLTSKEFLFNY